MPKKIDAAVKARASRMFAEHRQDYPPDTALAEAVAKKVGIGGRRLDGGWFRPTSTPVLRPVRPVSRPRGGRLNVALELRDKLRNTALAERFEPALPETSPES